MTPFDELKKRLRDAGCRVFIHDINRRHETCVELWQLWRPGADFPIRFIVVDEGEAGYHLFIENQTIRIEDDFNALMGA